MHSKLSVDAKKLARNLGCVQVNYEVIKDAGFGFILAVPESSYQDYYALDVMDQDWSDDSIGVHSHYEMFDNEYGEPLCFSIDINNLFISDGEVFAEVYSNA